MRRLEALAVIRIPDLARRAGGTRRRARPANATALAVLLRHACATSRLGGRRRRRARRGRPCGRRRRAGGGELRVDEE